MSNTVTPIDEQAAFTHRGLLPAPRMSQRPTIPPADVVEELAGSRLAAPLKEWHALLTEAAEARTALEANRPGPNGHIWRAALRQDADDYAAGKRPERWRAADLADGDSQRWATVAAAARAIPAAYARFEQRLDRTKIAKEARSKAAPIGEELVGVANEAWIHRAKPAKVWPLFERGQELRRQYGAPTAVAKWAEGGTYVAGRADDPDPLTAGIWWALERLLADGKSQHLSTPSGIQLPEGAADELGVPDPDGESPKSSQPRNGYAARLMGLRS